MEKEEKDKVTLMDNFSQPNACSINLVGNDGRRSLVLARICSKSLLPSGVCGGWELWKLRL